MTKKKRDTSKLSGQEKLKFIEQIYVRYPRIDQLLEKINYCRVHSKIAKEPDCLLITGAPGAGKTSLCERYVKKFPPKAVKKTTAEGIKSVIVTPILFITCPTKATEKSLVETLLTELGDPEATKGTLTTQTLRLHKFVNDCEVEVIIIDEFQHLWDRDGKVIRRNAANYLKEIIIRTKKPMICVGMPTSTDILDDNEQLKRRFKRESLTPLKWAPSPQKRNQEPVNELKTFLSCLDSALPLKRSNLADEDVAECFHKATRGVVDKVIRLTHMAVALAIEYDLDSLSNEVLAEAYEIELRDDEPEKENPFGYCTPQRVNRRVHKAAKENAMNRRVRSRGRKKPAASTLLHRR